MVHKDTGADLHLSNKYWIDMTDPRGTSKEQFNIPFYSIWQETTTEFIQLGLTNGFEHSFQQRGKMLSSTDCGATECFGQIR